MPTLQHKIQSYFRNKSNDRLAREIASEIYEILYRANEGQQINFNGVILSFEQDRTSIENDIYFIYYMLKTSNSPIEV